MPRLITSTPAARLAATLRSSSANRYGGMRSRRSLCLIQLLAEFVTELATVDGHRPARQRDAQLLVDLHLQLAAVEQDPHVGGAAREAVRDRGAARAGARRQGLPHPALEDAGADQAGLELGVPRDVGAIGK